MKKVVIGIGSNVECRTQMVDKAIKYLESLLVNPVGSAVYDTLPEGSARHPYANAVIMGLTDLSQEQMSATLKKYELENGRTAQLKALDIVPIDLDLTVYDNTILRPHDFEALYFTKGYEMIK